MHKLRRAMVRPERDRLSGIVEVDETFVGGVSVGRAHAQRRCFSARVAWLSLYFVSSPDLNSNNDFSVN